MDKQTRNLLWPIVIILFALGLWPVAIILSIIIILSFYEQKQLDIESLKKENEALKQKLNEKIIDDIIAKTKNRKGR